MGYLYKRARKSGRNWRKRWIVANMQRGVISYYKTRKAHDAHKKPTGSVQLPKPFFTYIERSPSVGKHARAHAFEIYTVNPGTGSRSDIFHLAAENDADANVWFQAFRETACRGGTVSSNSSAPKVGGQGGNAPMAKASAPAVGVDPQADRERTRILRNAGRRRMSVGMIDGVFAQAERCSTCPRRRGRAPAL